MRPKRWGLNLPGRDFRFEWEDLIPAIAGTIGLVVMCTAITKSFASAYGLDMAFIVENVRVDMIAVSLFFVILFSGIFNPRANLAGIHGPMLPLIPLMAASGSHPLALGGLIAVFGIILSVSKGGSRLVKVTSQGVAGGLLVYLGAIGTIGQVGAIRAWAESLNLGYIGFAVLFGNFLLYAYLARIGKRWLSIPLCSLFAAVIALSLGAPFEFTTGPGLPSFNPMYWWGETTGWKLGLPGMTHFIAALPFAILAVAMWSPDFLGHRIFQEMNYPAKAKHVLMDVDDTMIGCSLRQVVTNIVGSGCITSSWGTYMIPAAIAKRPIPGGAILTGVLSIVVAIAGFPMDIAVWRPVLSIALLVGVYLPLLEAGMEMVHNTKDAKAAGACIFASAIVNPVFGWALTMFLDNNGLIADKERAAGLNLVDRFVIPGLGFIISTLAMAVVGMIPGIPALIK
ncbi:membrane protein [Pseudodesulfovibrio sediminis]|uniref:Membrane protein n=2 Tax=Pseudodesulfovibrio sediminis TaxID=2810563 RepID=A0ABM7P3Y0_9BACT|nr:membrane protein [Pseudodesulfovibrio sediminis]